MLCILVRERHELCALFAQVVHLQSLYPNDTTEGGYITEFNRWRMFYENRMANDASQGENTISLANSAMHYFLQNQNNYCSSSWYAGNWQCLGPFRNYYGPNVIERQGRVDAVWIRPDSINIMLAGAHTGGLLKTNNGGHDWRNVTDSSNNSSSVIPGTMGVSHIAVNPFDSNRIYLALNINSSIERGDGVMRQILRIPCEYKGHQGYFEFIKEPNGMINHRFFNTK